MLTTTTPGTIAITPAQLDADPFLLNVANGTLDVRTGLLRPHRREDLLTKLAPVPYDPEATCPTWTAFLHRILHGDAELLGFLQRAVGYSLTGSTDEQVLFLLYGTGANGKSTFLETLRAVLGDYARQADFSTFLLQQGGAARNDIARLVGSRLVEATEMERGGRLDEVVVKQLTGGDTVTARFLYREFFEFRPAFKLWLAANHKPEVRGTDDGIWRRIRLIPFTVRIPDAEQDRRLPEKLRAELPGILAWAVRGCLDWQRSGLGVPPEVREATDAYRDEMDALTGFLAEGCILGAGHKVSAQLLYADYTDWCKQNGEAALSQRAFGLRLAERGLQRRRSGPSGAIVYHGIDVRSLN